MKIFACGDFHGSVPAKFRAIARSCDFVLCTGDMANRDKERQIYFKHWKALGEGHDLFEFIDKKQFRKLLIETVKSSVPVIKILDSWGAPVIIIHGNGDFTKDRIKGYFKGFGIPKNLPRFEQLVKKTKNINYFSSSVVDFDERYQIITFSCTSGDVSDEVDVMMLKQLFKQKMKNKKIIFLTHEPPYGTKLDLTTYGPAKGKHIGSKPVMWAIKKYKPALNISGHVHETQGVSRIGKTVCVNVGYGKRGQAAVIELGKKIKIRLVK